MNLIDFELERRRVNVAEERMRRDARRARRRLWYLASFVVLVLIALVCRDVLGGAQPERHASAYVYQNGRPVDPIERSQYHLKRLARSLGHIGPGEMQFCLGVDLLASDKLVTRALWPHAAGVDTCWFARVDGVFDGKQSYVVVGKVGREVPDSVSVVLADGSILTEPVRRKQ